MPRRCPICFYRIDDYGPDEVVCGACLDSYTEEAASWGDPEARRMMAERQEEPDGAPA